MTMIQLSDHFTYNKLIRFTLPSIAMMIFTSVYVVVDGLFVSNWVGKTPFAALNLIWPVIQALGAIGFMIGTGGSALVAKLLGEGRKEEANSVFSLLIYFAFVLAVALAALALFYLRPIAVFFGAEGEMLEYCLRYGRILAVFSVVALLQNMFPSFLVAAERPKLGLYITLIAGCTNIVLDALFVAVLGWGLAGAAFATGISQLVGGAVPLLYFIRATESPLRLGRAKWNGAALLKACSNGASEMMTNLSMSLVSILYNFQLMRLAGEDGVAAYGVLMYLSFVFIAVFLGYTVGSAPIVSFHYGAQNDAELQNMLRKSLMLVGISGLMMVGGSLALAQPLSAVFVGYDKPLLEMTVRGMRLYSFSFIFTGFNILGSAFFTALNNGFISALISFLRTLVFQVVAVIWLPLRFGLDGVWLALIAAEAAAVLVVAACFIGLRKRYRYW
ncbi:MAG: MATE family efflux transporter [Firmicutes bacterium]|nr:MATE family efflux transporter [Bacillota bacterium]